MNNLGKPTVDQDGSATLVTLKYLDLRQKQLFEIRKCRLHRRESNFGPLFMFSFGLSFVAAITIGVINLVFQSIGYSYSLIETPVLRQIASFSPLITGVLVFIGCLASAKMPKTWSELLDKQLFLYEPINTFAYYSLQKNTKSTGFLSDRALNDWLDIELGEINSLKEKIKFNSQSFLNKEILVTDAMKAQMLVNSPDHPDNAAVDQFAVAMKEKLALARAKGRSGWDDPDQFSVEHLSALLHICVEKGDPIDVANFCMMLSHRNSRIIKKNLVINNTSDE